MVRFIVVLLVVASLIVGIVLISVSERPQFLYQTVVFLFLTTTGLYHYLLKTKQQRPDYFVQLYLLTMVVKMIASGTYLFVMVWGQPNPIPDVVLFMVVYFVFTALEIGFLYRKVNS
jgi:hypothetical protein